MRRDFHQSVFMSLDSCEEVCGCGCGFLRLDWKSICLSHIFGSLQ